MIDKEKIRRGAECCKYNPSVNGCSEECPYLPEGHLTCGLDPFLDDVIALLKEQEPVKAVADGEDSYICNNCGTVIGWAEWEPGGIETVKYKFCPECGRLVKWDD